MKIACFSFRSAVLFPLQHRPGDISTKGRRGIVKRGESFGDSSSPRSPPLRKIGGKMREAEVTDWFIGRRESFLSFFFFFSFSSPPS